MSNETTALKPSFFKEYFRLKLRGLKGFTITFAVMNFLIYTVFTAIILISEITYKKLVESGTMTLTYQFTIAIEIVALFVALIFAAEGILVIVMAAMNFKSYHNRSAMDTIGGLPLTISQRFFGDILSGAVSFFVSFIPCSISALIMSAVLQYGIDPPSERYETLIEAEYVFPRFHDNYLTLAALLILTLLICVIAAYAVTCFVTSCCGKLNVSIIFSIVTVCAIPLIVGTFNAYILNNAVGVSEGDYLRCVASIPPVGTAIYLVWMVFFGSFAHYEFTVATSKLIIMLAFIVLPMTASYIIAKRRKAERVDKPFIYKIAYTVVSLIITAAALGVVLLNLKAVSFIMPLLIFTAAACVYIEYLRTHSKRTLWAGMLRFAGSAAVCAGFGLLVYSTNGFDIGKKLPDKNRIESVTVYRLDELNYAMSPTLDEESVISAVLSEHDKIIENIEKFEKKSDPNGYIYDGESLELSYNMKDGTAVRRSYSSHDGEGDKLIRDFKTAIRSMPEVYNRTTLGILGNPDMPCTGIELIYYYGAPADYCIIKPSVRDEFIRCLRNDLVNYGREAHTNSEDRGYINYSYTVSGNPKKIEYLAIDEKYKETNEFLSDPDNYSTNIGIDLDDETAVYSVVYYDDTTNFESYNDITLKCTVNANSAAARELISYFETEYSVFDDYSTKIRVSVEGKELRVKKENERAALSALIRVMKELETRGELS